MIKIWRWLLVHSDTHILLIMFMNRIEFQVFFCTFYAWINPFNFFEGFLGVGLNIRLLTGIYEWLFEFRRIFKCFFNGLNFIATADHGLKNDFEWIDEGLMLISSISFGLKSIKLSMTLTAFESDFYNKSMITGELFDGCKLSLDLKVSKKTDEFIRIQCEYNLFKVFF